MGIKQVTAEGFTVIVEMDDGKQYPFRTHPEAAKLFGAAPALAAALDQLLAEVLGDNQALACVDLRIIDRAKAALAMAKSVDEPKSPADWCVPCGARRRDAHNGRCPRHPPTEVA